MFLNYILMQLKFFYFFKHFIPVANKYTLK